MTMFFVCITIICLAILLAFLVCRAILRWWRGEPEPMPAPLPQVTEEVSLEELSLIWTIPIQDHITGFSDLKKYERSQPKNNASDQSRPCPVFRHREIARYHQERVEAGSIFTGDARECVEDILKLLDQEGGCPSVVNRNPREAERGLEQDIYAALTGVPLYLHSLNVAGEIASICNQRKFLAVAVIAGLAHDLGKIPSFQNKLHSSGDHGAIAPIVLGTLDSFRKLPFGGDVIEAIRQHHRPNPEPELAIWLRDADKAARMRELAEMPEPGGK